MNTGKLDKIKISLRNYGLLSTIVIAIRYLIQITVGFFRRYKTLLIKAAIDYRFDKKFGIDTAGKIKIDALDLNYNSAEHASPYEGTPPKAFIGVMRQIPADYITHSIFVDFGSGKARSVLLASEYPFKKIIGIEFSPQLHSVAKLNCLKYRNTTQKCNNIELKCMNAIDYNISSQQAIFFFYNPFNSTIMEKMASKIQKSLQEFPRKAFVVYFWPMHQEIWDDIDLFERYPIRQPIWPTKVSKKVVAVWVTKATI